MIDPELQKEYFLANTENNRIIPCIFKEESRAGKKWGLDKISGLSFSDADDLINKVLLLLNSENNTGSHSDRSPNFLSFKSTKKLNQYRRQRNMSIIILVIAVCSIFFVYLFMFQPSVSNSKEYYNSGMNFTKSGQYRESITDFNKAIELDPSYVSAYYNKGTAFESLGDYTGAIENYNKAIELDPSYVTVLEEGKNISVD